MASVLITSVGSLVGTNVLACIERYRRLLTVVGTNSTADAVNNFRCDACYLAPQVSDGVAWRAHLRTIIEAEAVDLVIPGRDEDVLELARWLQDEPGLAPRLLVGNAHAALAFQDKVDCAAFAIKHGLPFATTVATGQPGALVAAEQLLNRAGLPLIAKPRAGNGSRGVRLLTSEAQVRFCAESKDYALQAYLDPHPSWQNLADDWQLGVPLWFEIPERALFGAQVLIDPSGQVSDSFCFRAEMSAGRPALLEPDSSSDLHELALAYGTAFAAAGWRGPCNVQAKRDDRLGLLAIETNGRFSGGTSARMGLGFDEVRIVLQQWLGIALPSSGERSVGPRKIIKELTDQPLSTEHARQLAREGWWRHPSS